MSGWTLQLARSLGVGAPTGARLHWGTRACLVGMRGPVPVTQGGCRPAEKTAWEGGSGPVLGPGGEYRAGLELEGHARNISCFSGPC